MTEKEKEAKPINFYELTGDQCLKTLETNLEKGLTEK